MEREIKFRAWDKDSKLMLYKEFYDHNWYTTPKNDEDGCHTYSSMQYSDQYHKELMQYTGLKDKNGVEIYEGDILQNGDAIHSITFSEAAFWWGDAPLNIIKRIDRGVYKWGRDIENMEFHEVIGNIYENAELLESTKTK